MRLDDLLSTLATRKLKLRLDADRISVRGPRGGLTAELREQIAAHRPALVGLLQLDPAATGSGRTAGRAPRTESLPLSFAEQRLWFLDQLEGGTDTYSLPAALRVRGALDLEALTWSLDQIVRRHEILRTSYRDADGTPVRAILDELHVDVAVTDASTFASVGDDPAGPSEQTLVRDWVRAEAQRPFDLAHPPLLRVSALRLRERELILLLNMHHIVSDGWSMSVLVKELTHFYGGRLRGVHAELPPLPIQYADYAYWQRRSDPSAAEGLDYWRRKLEDAPPIIGLALDRPRPAVQTYEGAAVPFQVPLDVSRGLAALARRQGTTKYVLLLSAFKLLLARYCHERDIVVGSTFANRPSEELEGLIGFFVNTLALRTDVSPALTLRELIERVGADAIGSFAHSDVPFERVVEAVQPERSLSHSPVVQVLFDFHNTPPVELSLSGLTIELLPLHGSVSRFDLSVDMKESGDLLQGAFEYNVRLFSAATVQRMVQHFLRILAEVVRDPDQRIGNVSMLLWEERERAIVQWNDTDRDYPRDRRVHELFSEQARRTPHAVAASCDGACLTYGALERRSNGVAHALLAKGVGVEDRVALFMDRGLDYLTGMLGALKAGCAFVPLDPQLAEGRTRAVLRECEPVQTLVCGPDEPRLSALVPPDRILRMEDALRVDGSSAPAERSAANGLAYVMYTSGSTGNPKGVMIEHEGMVNHIWAHVRDQEIGHRDVVGQIAVQTFDISVWQFLCALVVGGRTAIITGEASWVPALLLERVSREGLTILQTVPSHTVALLDELESRPERYALGELRWFMNHAETLTAEHCRRWSRAVPGCRMINGYGATEVSDDSSQFHVPLPPPSEPSNVSIGGVLANMAHYVLDQSGAPAPIGVVGEVFVGGVGVGRGYQRDPALTARVFLPDPFSSRAGARLYATGDLARYRSDGTFEFMGRVDFQVRIRGFRVEIGEIETQLGRHRRVKQCLVVAKQSGRGDSQLVGYVIPESYPAPLPSELESFLSESLPPYMIPRQFVFLDNFPRGRTGKASRRLLPAPALRSSDDEYVAPRTPMERDMAALWAQALRLERVGVRDNFFQRGGHSLLAAELIVKVRRLLGRDVPLRCLFEGPTVESFVTAMGDGGGSADPGRGREAPLLSDGPLARVRRFASDGPVAMAPAQIPVWYSYVLAPDSIVYNVNYGALPLQGDLDIDAFVGAWQAFVDRHDVFRLRFAHRDGCPMQWLGPPIELSREGVVIDLSSRPAEEREAELARLDDAYAKGAFDLERGPLLRLALVDCGDGNYSLLFATHHVIWDEQSMMNMYAEVSELYNARVEERPARLPELTVGYLDYARWMNECIQAADFEVHRRYWLDMFQQMPPALDLPTDFPRPAIITYNGDWVFSWLPRETARKLDAFLAKQNVTLFMFMLAVLDLWLHRLTGQDDLVIGCPIAGRDHEAFQPLVGLFATPMPIRVRLGADQLFSDLLREVSKRSIEAYEHHLYPATNLIEELSHVKDLSRPRLYSIMYGVQNDKTQAVGGLRFSGLRADRSRPGRDRSSARLGARFDLNLIVDRWGGDVCVNCIYNTDLFRKETVEYFLESMNRLAEAVIADPDKRLWEYRLHLSEAQLQSGRQRNTLAYDEAATLNALFAQQVERSPDRVAVTMGSAAVTYGEMAGHVAALARRLLAEGVEPGDSLLLLLDPSIEMITAMLATLSVGACYVPVSPTAPVQRVGQIAGAAEARWALTHARYTSMLDGLSALIVDCGGSPGPIGDPAGPRTWTSESVAYVLYTSGTTGTPKGIGIRHRGVVNLLASTQAAYRLTAEDRVLFTTPYTFDASILDVFWPLAYGASVVIADPGTSRSPAALGRKLVEEGITVAQTVPIMLEALAEARQDGQFDDPGSLRLIICGGDAMSRRVRDLARATFRAQLFNHYGPTEVTVDATVFDCSADFDGEIVPIGRPIANVEVFVLDERRLTVPPGVIGELYVSSPGLAVGYQGDQARTQESFQVIDPGDGTARRMYRTGDLGRLGRDGTIYFVGRRDKQVKVRGNRVELEEVTQTLLCHEAVAAATVALGSDSMHGGVLTAFVELAPRTNAFEIRGATYRAFTLAQRPELAKPMTELHLAAWPAYFEGDATMARYWPRLFSEAPGHQVALTAEDGEVAAIINAVPMCWDGRVDDLPRGWSDALARGLEGASEGQVPDTFMLLTAVVAEQFRAKGLAAGALHVARAVATGLGAQRIVVAVRPTGKVEHPDTSFGDWCHARRPDGELLDDWLRMHERAGGRLISICLDSQRIEGSIADWERWTGWRPSGGDPCNIPGTLQPATFDDQQDRVRYCDPAVWFEHRLLPADQAHWRPVDRAELRRFLGARLPDYMVPDRYRFLEHMPLTHSGTVDERALHAMAQPVGAERISPRSALEKQIAGMWKAVLKVDDVGVHDDFFDHGGQSLKAIQLLGLVERATGVKVPLLAFYRNSTVSGLGQLVGASHVDPSTRPQPGQ